MTNSKFKINRYTYNIFLFFLFFSTFFLLKFKAVEFLSPLRISLFLTTLLFLPQILNHFKSDLRKYYIFYFLLFIVVLYTILQVILLETDFGMLSRTTVFVVFTLYLSVSFHFLFKDHHHFLKIVTYCCLFQAVMVYISFFYPPYRAWLDTVMVHGGNIPFAYGARVPGFSTGSGASLSIALALGCFCSMCCFYFEKTKKRFKYLLIAFFIFSSCIVVGKTGLLLCMYFMFSVILISFSPSFIIFSFLTLFSLLIIVFLSTGFEFDVLTLALPEDQKQLVTAIFRSFGFLFGREDVTISALQDMPIPKLDIVSILGTGSNNDAKGNSLTGSDIGYISSYYGYGIVIAVVFYVAVFGYSIKRLWEVRNTQFSLLAIILFIPLFIIELKEPFIFKIAYPFIFFVFLNLINKDQQKHFYGNSDLSYQKL